MKWGFGTAVYLRKAHYEGHFFMDKRHGFGKMRYSNAGTYEVSPSAPKMPEILKCPKRPESQVHVGGEAG